MSEERELYDAGAGGAAGAIERGQLAELAEIRQHIEFVIARDDRQAAAFAEIRNILRDAVGLVDQARGKYLDVIEAAD